MIIIIINGKTMLWVCVCLFSVNLSGRYLWCFSFPFPSVAPVVEGGLHTLPGTSKYNPSGIVNNSVLLVIDACTIC